MLFIVEYVEIMYVYTLKYVYIYGIYVYMYLYVNKDSLLNLALACSIFDFFQNVALCLYIYTKLRHCNTSPNVFPQLEFVFLGDIEVCATVNCATSLGRAGSIAFRNIREMKCMF